MGTQRVMLRFPMLVVLLLALVKEASAQFYFYTYDVWMIVIGVFFAVVLCLVCLRIFIRSSVRARMRRDQAVLLSDGQVYYSSIETCPHGIRKEMFCQFCADEQHVAMTNYHASSE